MFRPSLPQITESWNLHDDVVRQELREWIKTTWFQAGFEKWMELTDAIVEGSTFGMGWDKRLKRNDDNDGDLHIYHLPWPEFQVQNLRFWGKHVTVSTFCGNSHERPANIHWCRSLSIKGMSLPNRTIGYPQRLQNTTKEVE